MSVNNGVYIVIELYEPKKLEAELRESKKKQWLEENKQAIENCNELVARHGLFSDKFRKF